MKCISNLIWENKVKTTVKELLPTKNKGQSLNNLEQNNNLPYCNDNENNKHKISKKRLTAALFVSGQAFAIDRSPVQKINNKK